MAEQNAAPAADEPIVDDGLSQVEKDYFSSRGEKTDGLGDSAPAVDKPAEPAAKTAEPPPADDKPPDGGEEEFDDRGEPKNKGKWVRHGALHAERERRKQTEVRLRESEEARTRYDERLKLINEALAPRQEAIPEDVPPDPEADIFGYAKWQGRKMERLQAALDETTKGVVETRQTMAERDAERQLHSNYQNDAVQFIRTTPDFVSAYQHLVRSRDAELQAWGETDPQKRQAIIWGEERELVQRSHGSNTSAAARIYELAKLRGYQLAPPVAAAPAAVPAAPPAAASPPAAPGTALGAPAPAAAKPAPNVTDEINRIKAGQGAAMSLSNAGGSPGDTLTPEHLANMPQDEFAALLARLPKSRQRELLGS